GAAPEQRPHRPPPGWTPRSRTRTAAVEPPYSPSVRAPPGQVKRGTAAPIGAPGMGQGRGAARTKGAEPSAGAVAPRAREDLAGVQQPARIEDRLQLPLHRDQIRGLLEVQIRRLDEADAVLAAERPAEGHRGAEQLLDRTLDLGLLRGIVPEEVDVEVAVARVPVGQGDDLVALRALAHVTQQLAQAAPRHDHVLAHLVARLATHGEAHLSPRRPQARPLPLAL